MSNFKPYDDSNPTPDSVWEENWKDICTNPDGSLNLEAIKNELFDYNFMLDQVPIVYDEVTGGRISKPNTYAFEVIGQYRAILDEQYIYKEDLEADTEGTDMVATDPDTTISPSNPPTEASGTAEETDR